MNRITRLLATLRKPTLRFLASCCVNHYSSTAAASSVSQKGPFLNGYGWTIGWTSIAILTVGLATWSCHRKQLFLAWLLLEVVFFFVNMTRYLTHITPSVSTIDTRVSQVLFL